MNGYEWLCFTAVHIDYSVFSSSTIGLPSSVFKVCLYDRLNTVVAIFEHGGYAMLQSSEEFLKQYIAQVKQSDLRSLF